MPALVCGAILLAAGLLRWFSAGRVGLWRDEVQFMEIASLPNARAIVAFLLEHESHPPFYYILGHVAGKIFGSVQGPMGLLAIAVSLLSVYLVYALGARAFTRAAAILASAGTAASVPLIVFSVQLRPYALLTALALAAHAGLFGYWTDGRRRHLILWAVATILLFYTHHVAVLLFAVQVGSAAWLQWRGPRLTRDALRLLNKWALLVLAAALPALWMLAIQSQSAGYPAAQPFRWARPIVQLLDLGLTFPFEVLLPLVVGVIALVSSGLARDRHYGPLGHARPLLTAVAPLYFLAAVVATYRSQFLVPHLILLVAPFGMLLLAGHISSLWQRGHRWRAGIWGELVVAAIVVGALLLRDFNKTNTHALAASVEAEAVPSDLIILVPGAAGASFNHYYTGHNQQIDFPYVGALTSYRFDDDFAKVTSPSALQVTRDSIDAAFRSKRRVWLVTEARWLRDDLPAPEVLSRDSFGGIGQPDRARANLFDRELSARFGHPIRVIGPDRSARGQELLTARLYAAPSGTAHPESLHAGAVR